MPIDKPVQRGVPMISPKGDQVWVAFQYERLQGCFHYGLLGHEAKSSIVRLRDGEETPYGEWLCASFRRPKFQQTRAPPTPPRRDQVDKVQGSTADQPNLGDDKSSTYKSCD